MADDDTGAPAPAQKIEDQTDDLRCPYPTCAADLCVQGVRAGYTEDQSVTIARMGGVATYELEEANGGELTGPAYCRACGKELPHDSAYYGARFEGMPVAGPLGADEGGQENGPDEESEEPEGTEDDPAADALANHEAMEPQHPPEPGPMRSHLIREDDLNAAKNALTALKDYAERMRKGGGDDGEGRLCAQAADALARLATTDPHPRAANTHDDLLELVKDLMDNVEQNVNGECPWCGSALPDPIAADSCASDDCEGVKARALIAKAKAVK